MWVDNIPFIVPSHLSLTQEKYLIASQLTVLMRNTSVDNVLKNWFEGFEEERKKDDQDPKLVLVDEILSVSRSHSYNIHHRFKNLNFDFETKSSFVCEATFSRLPTTFKSIHFHIKFGYYYESFALIRLVLEQLAFAYTASRVSEGFLEDFLSPTESIKYLKELIKDAGKLYGSLSKKSHIDKSTIPKYLETENSQSHVTTHSVFFSLEASKYLLHIIDYQSIAFEYCFRGFLKDYSCILKEADGRYTVNPNRNHKEQFNNYIERVNALLRK